MAVHYPLISSSWVHLTLSVEDQWLGFSNHCNCSFRFSEIRVKKVGLRRYGIRCEERDSLALKEERNDKKRLRLLIAGGGIGGLVLALAAKKRGYDVKVFEKDLSAVKGEGQHRGPIQLLSSALAVLEAIDEDVARQIAEAGCVTGNRINGLADGLSGEWFTKYDLLTPALARGLPVTEVISRIALQDILVNAVGMDIVNNTSKVVDFVQDSNKVKVVLEDGREHEGDVLVGADGIWSKVRAKLVGAKPANYSNYTCYSGFTDFVPPYVDTVGYRVFLGLNQYFVASDVGSGKMQWYAFHKEAPMTNDPPGGKKERLLELFGNWCSEVVTLILETPEDMILKRDIYDRDMIYSWGNGRVTLLGDAAHPMQPNLGQGGCMAIEDCYQLIAELDKVPTSGSGAFLSSEIGSALKRYEKKRVPRVSIVHAATRTASKLLSYYQPYIEFRSGLLPWFVVSAIQASGYPFGPRVSAIIFAAVYAMDDSGSRSETEDLKKTWTSQQNEYLKTIAKLPTAVCQCLIVDKSANIDFAKLRSQGQNRRKYMFVIRVPRNSYH